VRLLLDGGLSPRLVDRLADVYPGSMHVERGQHQTSDRTLVQLAGLMDSVIVTNAADFDDLVMLEAEGGRVLRLDVGPCTTGEVEGLLRALASRLPELFSEARHVTIGR